MFQATTSVKVTGTTFPNRDIVPYRRILDIKIVWKCFKEGDII